MPVLEARKYKQKMYISTQQLIQTKAIETQIFLFIFQEKDHQHKITFVLVYQHYLLK